MHRLLRAGDVEAEQLVGPIGDHLVGVHVLAGASPGLEGVDHELVVPAPGQDFVGGVHDRFGDLVSADRAIVQRLVPKQAQIAVDFGRRPLDHRHRPDEGRIATHTCDGEVLDCPLRLRAIQRVGGDL